MDAVIMLISREEHIDDYGVPRVSEVPRQVFCQAYSVTRQEFFEGGRNGLNPSLVFRMFAPDYHGEAVVEYNGFRYGVYRTYQVPGEDYMEIYVERKGGLNHEESNC